MKPRQLSILRLNCDPALSSFVAHIRSASSHDVSRSRILVADSGPLSLDIEAPAQLGGKEWEY